MRQQIIRGRIYPAQSLPATSLSHVTSPRHHPPQSPLPLGSYMSNHVFHFQNLI
jgi:hypothetical protein